MLLITCPFGLSSLLTTELKRMGYKPLEVFPTGCRVDTSSLEDIMKINLQARIANKVFLEVGYGLATTFDHMFELVHEVDRANYIVPSQGFTVGGITMESTLNSLPTLQSITQKAIATRLTGNKDVHWEITDSTPALDIYLYIHKNQVHITINTSGPSLHQRGRRVEQGEAPIKENLAIATLLLASWPFHKPLRDPCCGSGTLVIEAARLAKNVASGMQRIFAFEYLPNFSREKFEQLRKELKEKEITKPRTIIGSDSDSAMIEKAKVNAKNAGVDDIVQFYFHDVMQPTKLPALQEATTVICNPPYGQRLHDIDVDAIHRRLAQLIIQPGWNGAIITGYEHAENIFPLTQRKRKETRQGKEKCYIYILKGGVFN